MVCIGSQFPSERDRTLFRGTFPSEIRQLTNLIQLNLKEALTEGPITEDFKSLRNLKELNLENNNMNGTLPDFLSSENFPALEILLLTNNQIEGTIPNSHGTLSNLIQYRVAKNKLTKTIPPELANIAGLGTFHWTLDERVAVYDLMCLLTMILLCFLNPAYLDVSENELTGSVSPAIFELAELRILSLHGNVDLEMELPSTINILSNLERLKLQSTRLRGIIPTPLYTIPNLKEINLRDTDITGVIDPSVANAVSLQIFDVAGTGIGGELPSVFDTIAYLGKRNATPSLPKSGSLF